MKRPLRTLMPIFLFSISDMQELLQTQEFQETTLETIPETKTELLNVYSDDEYIRKIQKRVEEDTSAREQRAKRRRKMLVDQLAAHEAQEVGNCMLKYIVHVQLISNLECIKYKYRMSTSGRLNKI